MKQLSYLTAMSALLAAASASAKEKPIKLAELPAAVRATVDRELKGGKIRGLDAQTENGKTTYEAELTVKGVKKDLSLDETGNILEVEEGVALKDVPDAARAAIEKAAGKGKVVAVETVGDGTKVDVYEAVIKTGAKKSEVRFDPQGKPAPKK